ncbi:Carbohydrate kinase, FGGY-like protein [Acidipropionibacterium acidipropionici ATCC 4875]|uniref:Carbohydrate kinase, FGGY-like protein n=1 Tax=Acidipropionibacterium acidipropionici (strain ATCC 4875 / DSM 20272 / JCM 6432 / NBRC 12425 / NCIMB 8070 / 4) TaxID=1171373 RepID=K7RPJ3_ACIA4|nr:FGGY-family carbohydrate kinase [Acidipropionibacterium acidipropionici]AFV89909.1 Carbohydrate kinase, FGGY-like protein [Acidipropionibacterium acidipropionici ATCC 4875]
MTTADIDPGRARDVIETGRASLGIEFGSTNIKACLIGPDYTPLASGSHAWENEFVDGRWTYSLEAVWAGLQACYADLITDAQRLYDVTPTSFRAIGISAMMHGYLAFDAAGDLLVPFRTWRNTSTGPAAAELTEALGFNIPQRWSIAHLYQAVLDEEPHIGRIAALNTLAGYVHQKLTGKTVLGVGDASGMFPIDPATGGYDQRMLAIVDPLIDARVPGLKLEKLLPDVLPAGAAAGDLTAEGAALLDPTGALKAGVPFCPPEGDAGTGMVATNSVARRTGNVSVGTSAFAMVVLEHPLEQVHEEIDVVTTPAGDAVAMVHCNNGASELSAWAGLFGRFAKAIGSGVDQDGVFAALLNEALAGRADGGGLLSFNNLAGEPVAGLPDGRPMVVRAPDSSFTLANFMRTQVYAVFSTLSLGMRILDAEKVQVDRLLAHGGLFRTAGPAQRILAAALGAPVAVGETAGEGGPWGMALLAAYLGEADSKSLAQFLDQEVFATTSTSVMEPARADVDGFSVYLDRYRRSLELQRVAPQAVLPVNG